jgi:hypothetical protein
MLNKESYTRRLALLSSEKLINQLDKIVLGLAALIAVLVIETRLRPIASVISEDKILGLIGIIEY